MVKSNHINLLFNIYNYLFEYSGFTIYAKLIIKPGKFFNLLK